MNVIKDKCFEGKILDLTEKTIEYVRSQIKGHTYLGADARFVTEPEYHTEAFMIYATIRNPDKPSSSKQKYVARV